MSDEFLVDPDTGEVLATVDEAARELVAVKLARDELAAQDAALARRQRLLEQHAVTTTPVGERLDGGSHWVAVVPAPRPAQRVSRSGCAPFVEQLLDLGLGEMAYSPPTISAVRAAAGRLVAAGVPIGAVAPEPVPGPPRVEVIPKGAGV